MITANEINNQLEITRSVLTEVSLSEDEWAFTSGYLRALSYVLGQAKAKYNKEDI